MAELYTATFIRSHDRDLKAERILRILRKYVDIEKCRTLDIGCGDGKISSIISKRSLDHTGIDRVDERKYKDFNFYKTSIKDFKPKEKFDVILMKSVIEHFDLKKAYPQIDKKVKQGGIIYISVAKYYSPFDLHYYLPFIYYLPGQRLKDLYVRVSGRGSQFDIRLWSLRELKRLFKGYEFHQEMYQAMRNKLNVLRFVPKPLLNFLCPSYVLILKKK